MKFLNMPNGPLDGTTFIKCADCSTAVDDAPSTSSLVKALHLCLDCFSCGAELGSHKRTHRYYVKNPADQVSIFSGETLLGDGEPWSTREELGLLDGIERFNLGNWEDVANHYVKTSQKRSAREILEHYDRFYLHGVMGRATLQNLKRPEDRDYTTQLTALIDSDTTEGTAPTVKVLPSPPMRDSLRKMSSDDLRLLAYMPERDDFEKEFNNDAETLISNLMILPDDDDLDKAVKVAQIEMYIREVAERQRRKIVAREYDLVSQFLKQEKSFSNKAAYSYSVPEQKKLKMERDLREQLKKCAQFIPHAEFDQLISDIIKERSLKERIKELQDYRQAGVTTLEGEKRLQASESLILKHPLGADEAVESALPTAARRTLIDGTEYDSGKNAWLKQKRTPEAEPTVSVLSPLEVMLCEESSLSTQNYILLKAALLKEQVARMEGLPLRTSVGGCGGNVDDILEMKDIVKEFMKRSGWLPYFC